MIRVVHVPIVQISNICVPVNITCAKLHMTSGGANMLEIWTIGTCTTYTVSHMNKYSYIFCGVKYWGPLIHGTDRTKFTHYFTERTGQ